MIKKLLQTKPRTFTELHECLKGSHTTESLQSELDFLIEIGKIIIVKDKYKLL